jgi:hypothetical protein
MNKLDFETLNVSLTTCRAHLINASTELRETGKSHYTKTSALRKQHITHIAEKEDEWKLFQAQQQIDTKAGLDEQRKVCLIKIKAEQDDHSKTRETARLRLDQEIRNTASISAASERHSTKYKEDKAKIRRNCLDNKTTLQEQLSTAKSLNLVYESEVQSLQKKLSCQNKSSTPAPAVDVTTHLYEETSLVDTTTTDGPVTTAPPATEDPAFTRDPAIEVTTHLYEEISPPMSSVPTRGPTGDHTTLLAPPTTEDPAFTRDPAIEVTTNLYEEISPPTSSGPTRGPTGDHATLPTPSRTTSTLPTESKTTSEIISNSVPVTDVTKVINEYPSSEPRLQRDLTIETHPSSVPNDALQCAARNSLVMAVLVTLTLLETISLIYNIKNCLIFYKALWFPPPPPANN